jgi:glutamate-5-semialdehyde dehydrogenase
MEYMMNQQMTDLPQLAKSSRDASRILASASSGQKNEALFAMAEALLASQQTVTEANEKDLTYAREQGLSKAMIDRLILNEKRMQGMATALKDVAALKDPVGEISATQTRPNGIQVARMRIPLGVIAMIYESRPNVTSDAASLCIKAGNAVILRGGKEAFHSNHAIAQALHQGLEKAGLPREAVMVVPTTDRAAISELLTLDECIDLVIPRGGEGLIRFVAEHSRIPVIKHYKGVCHLFVDAGADHDMAIDLIIDGKTSRPGVCNALETVLVHQKEAKAFLPVALEYLRKANVEVRGCPETQNIDPSVTLATEADYEAEYLDLILAIRVVPDMQESIRHIQQYGSDHTEVIVTHDYARAREFVRKVDSSVVLVNASSRFSDGGELGLGTEIGISTTRLHAYGPMGLKALTTQKFVVFGDGQTRHNIAYRT